ncbi:hypothetical protein V8C86DRAFT_2738804 [Haematococcus lacustris]
MLPLGCVTSEPWQVPDSWEPGGVHWLEPWGQGGISHQPRGHLPPLCPESVLCPFHYILCLPPLFVYHSLPMPLLLLLLPLVAVRLQTGCITKPAVLPLLPQPLPVSPTPGAQATTGWPHLVPAPLPPPPPPPQLHPGPDPHAGGWCCVAPLPPHQPPHPVAQPPSLRVSPRRSHSQPASLASRWHPALTMAPPPAPPPPGCHQAQSEGCGWHLGGWQRG